MADTSSEFLQWRREALLREYEVVADTWRHLLGIRFGLMTIAAAIETVLFGAYRYLAIHPFELGTVSTVGLIALPFVGLVMTYAIMVIEVRTRFLRRQCLERALALERIFESFNSHFHRLAYTKAPIRFFTQTLAVLVIYVLVYLAWLSIALVELKR